MEVGNGNIITDRCTGSLVYFFCQKYCLRFLCTRLKSSSKILSSKGDARSSVPGVGPAARTRPRGLSPVSFTLSAALTVGKRRPFGFCSLPYLLPASRPRDRPRPGRRPRCESAAAPELGEGSEAGAAGRRCFRSGGLWCAISSLLVRLLRLLAGGGTTGCLPSLCPQASARWS